MAPASSGAGIRVDAVRHRYGRTEALRDVSVELPAGTTIGVIGPDGVGKSTLLGLIAGVRRLQDGRVVTLGCDMADRRAREGFLSRVAFMPQGLGKNLYPTLSVRENIDFFARLFGLDEGTREARIAQLLEATGLAPFPDRPAAQLSGGMKQKVSLCCALVHDPDLLILDEPTTGVDPLSRRQFWTLVDQLRARRPGMTVIVSTAYMEEAERFDWLVAMNDGRVLACDRTEAILRRTGRATLEEAYVSLLPEAERAGASALSIPPYRDPGGAPAIEADGLTKRFGKFIAVDHVSFHIGRGEIFGFLGSNGCGKSTTMKMLTGLLDVSEGGAKVFGRPVRAGDLESRMRIGYMSQGFSLYEELTVRQNLVLQARLFRFPAEEAARRAQAALTDFALEGVADLRPGGLPLGIRQRLQLAAACINDPSILILDEPTSGVDPAAREMFWRHLVALSREKQVTIFVSTHFMNEAARCDRISFMHRGRVLAVGTPDALVRARHAATLEDAFVAYLEEAMAGDGAGAPAGDAGAVPAGASPGRHVPATGIRGWVARAYAFGRREAVELLRDRLRLLFAVGGPVVLLLIAAFSISFDVNTIRFTVCDHDHSQASRELVEQFRGSPYFVQRDSSPDRAALEGRLRRGEADIGIDIPAAFGRDVAAGRDPAVGLAIDGAVPFLGANIRSYAEGVVMQYEQAMMREKGVVRLEISPVEVLPRFVYNQEFRSVYAMTPGIIMLALILIPTMLTALGVVREKEIGSIMNLYASPATVGQYLVGKQMPYVLVALVAYAALVLLSVICLGVPLKGSLLALSLGAVLYLFAATGLGLLVSAFTTSQVAAIFGAALICLIPGVNFSGLLYPVSTLSGLGYGVGLAFPAGWFQIISLGSFTKGVGAGTFTTAYLVLAASALACMLGARLLIRKQEP
ncbi:ribosome-associated ATPase/putative transporter RbbA [Gluconacetobacter takamatsuzukensis]|uniref:Ribosome-associated ATPase/putative transporter RbbA n=1 Tax=Gluconacetobacter takamatsuzukensis TaxID=1286190 RepID=A0A7W4KE73_9PROT|nr:ribosome-associated ATPase/putative transporter RbbA [Gluconacetobacter takamatsuzukensis]MBB2205293.1 ribosome-associated ATPase/putative transporter RbbA [Gluconacetobacter takamatsuzukensis]